MRQQQGVGDGSNYFLEATFFSLALNPADYGEDEKGRGQIGAKHFVEQHLL